MTPLAPMCLGCVHYRDFAAQQIGQERRVPTCDAFPDGIPDAIFLSGVEHDKPYPGDHGIQFEPKPLIDWSGLIRRIKKLAGK